MFERHAVDFARGVMRHYVEDDDFAGGGCSLLSAVLFGPGTVAAGLSCQSALSHCEAGRDHIGWAFEHSAEARRQRLRLVASASLTFPYLS